MAAIAKVWDGTGHGRDQKTQQASRKVEHFSKAKSTCSTRCAVFRKSWVAASRPESARDKTCPVGLAAVNSNHLRLCARSSLAIEELREYGIHISCLLLACGLIKALGGTPHARGSGGQGSMGTRNLWWLPHPGGSLRALTPPAREGGLVKASKGTRWLHRAKEASCSGPQHTLLWRAERRPRPQKEQAAHP